VRAMAATWERRAWLTVSVVALLGGWLAPQYAAKLWGSELNRFLQDSPFSAGVLVECFWLVLLIPGAVMRLMGQRREEQPDPEPAGRCQLGCGQATRAGWVMALQLCALVALVHVAWFASFSKTNVATNTLLWNTDTLTTPIAALIIARERPTSGAILGGLVGLVGAGLAVGASGAGDTFLGCGLVLAASFGYAVNTVLVEKVRDPRQVSVQKLLGLEGVVASVAVCFALLGAAVWRPEAIGEWISALPPMRWLAFLGVSTLFLNLGWLWCAELAGSFWTAMVACSTIPITVVLDMFLMGTNPTPATLGGSFLVIVGFTIASWPGASPEDVLPDEETGVMVDCCQRWQGWSQARAAPLLPPRSPGSQSTMATGVASDDSTVSEDAASVTMKHEFTTEGFEDASPHDTVSIRSEEEVDPEAEGGGAEAEGAEAEGTAAEEAAADEVREQ